MNRLDSIDFESRTLLVTAHPDDECMFFGPVLLHLIEHADVHILCCSNGNADGLGRVREKELKASAAEYGIDPAHAICIEHPMLQDGMQNNWDSDVIASIVSDYVMEKGIDQILTFDNWGVSGHINHISVHRGVRQYYTNLDKYESTDNIRVYTLVSVNVLRKYSGILDWIWTTFTSSRDSHAQTIFSFNMPKSTKAMMQHKSQFVWFRWLYVAFSRYMWMNTFKKM